MRDFTACLPALLLKKVQASSRVLAVSNLDTFCGSIKQRHCSYTINVPFLKPDLNAADVSAIYSISVWHSLTPISTFIVRDSLDVRDLHRLVC